MNDELELRLSRLAVLPTGGPPSVAWLHERSRRRAQRRAGLGAAAALTVGALIGVAALERVAAPPASVQTGGGVAQTTSAPAVSATGQPIVGSDGATAGWIDRATWDRALQEGPPALAIGTGAVEIRGFEVLADDGEVVGYFLPGEIGFLPLADASDPEVVDALVRSQPALTRDQAKALLEQMRDGAGD